jgi:hypothetical protein
MTRKTSKPYRMAPLQKLKVRPIKDPAEQAALDERLKRSEEAAAERPGDCFSGKEKALAVLELCRQLSAAGRLLVAHELTEELSLDQRMELLELLTAQLPAEAKHRFEERFRGQRGAVGDHGNSEDGTKK